MELFFFVNTLRPRQNGRHFADDTFNSIFSNENVRILIKFSVKFVPKGPNNNNPALVQIMAWRRPGDNPLSEPVMVSLLIDAYMRHSASMSSWKYYGCNITLFKLHSLPITTQPHWIYRCIFAWKNLNEWISITQWLMFLFREPSF